MSAFTFLILRLAEEQYNKRGPHGARDDDFIPAELQRENAAGS